MTDTPLISCICATYGRPSHLEEAIACFLNQTYPNKELIILNSLPDQELRFDHPQVKIINLSRRPATLGECRNMAIQQCSGEWLVTWDDDDIYLPNHLQNFAAALDSGDGWVRLTKQFYCEAWKIKKIVDGTFNVVAIAKRAWLAVGGYNSQNSGEDRQFCGKVTARFSGKEVHVQNDAISFLYGWDNEAYHISAKGDDQEGQKTGAQRVEEHVAGQLGAGMIGKGVVQLRPALRHDYANMAKAFLRSVGYVKSNRNGRIGMIMLGRFGDIYNVLPIAQRINSVWGKPLFFVAREFEKALSGVSYVDPVVIDMHYSHVHEAIDFAKSRCDFLINCQVWGNNFRRIEMHPYNVESWRHAGFLSGFYDLERYPLVFDKKVPEPAFPGDNSKPRILYSFECGYSSPFREGGRLLAELKQRFGDKAHLIDLCKVKLEHPHKLVSLYEASSVLISTDTMHLHLAAASSIPVIALVNSDYWLGTMTRFVSTAWIKYSEASKRVENICTVVDCLIQNTEPRRLVYQSPPVEEKDKRTKAKIFHTTNLRAKDVQSAREREVRARSTWNALDCIPDAVCQFRRDATDIGDPRDLPYLKDMLEFALLNPDCGNNDIVMWTNNDVALHPELPNALRRFIALYEVCTSFRVELPYGVEADVTKDPEEIALMSMGHMGRDMFAATAGWLRKYWNDIPDAIIGCPIFDLHLAALVRKQKGFNSDRQNLETLIPCCEFPRGYVIHEAHEAVWSRLPMTTPSHQHNSKLFQQWCSVNLPHMKFTPEGNI